MIKISKSQDSGAPQIIHFLNLSQQVFAVILHYLTSEKQSAGVFLTCRSFISHRVDVHRGEARAGGRNRNSRA